MRKKILLILILLLLPFSIASAEKVLLGHIRHSITQGYIRISPKGVPLNVNGLHCNKVYTQNDIQSEAKCLMTYGTSLHDHTVSETCHACNGAIFGSQLTTTFELPNESLVAQAFNISNATITYEDYKAYACSNGLKTALMNVYATYPPTTATIKMQVVGGEGTGYVWGNEYDNPDGVSNL